MAGVAGDRTIEFDAPDGGPSILDVGFWIDEAAPVAAALLLLVVFWLLAVRLLIGVLFPEGLLPHCDRRSCIQDVRWRTASRRLREYFEALRFSNSPGTS